MDRNRPVRRLDGTLEEWGRSHPDGPLPTYALVWRLLGEGGGNRVMRVGRFIGIVGADVLLLAGWWAVRPFRALARSVPGRVALGASMALAVGLVVLLGRSQGPPEHVVATSHQAGASDAIPATEVRAAPTIEIRADGGLVLGGRPVDDEGLSRGLDALAPTDVLVRIDATTRVGRVQQVTNLLVDNGIQRVRTEFLASGGA